MMVLAAVLTMTTSAVTPLYAAETESVAEESEILDSVLGEDGIAGWLFGEGGLLEGKLPEGTDVDGMINTLKEKLGEADSEISQLAEGIVEKVKEKYGSYDPESLKEILTPVLEKILGDGAALGDLGNLDFDKALAQNAMARELTADYIRDKNADIMESGDVQIVDVNNIFDEMSRSDSEEFPYVAYVLQSNYTEDEEHQLHYLCESADLIQLTLHEEEDGSLTVSDTQIVEEEDYEAFLQDLCKNGYKTAEDCLDSIEYGKACFPYVLSDYLEEHQEYTGIEYDGEMHTAEELDEIAAEHEASLYPEEAALYLQEAESDAQ